MKTIMTVPHLIPISSTPRNTNFMEKQNITLIGMAGAGKSSVGNILTQSLGWKFIDTDTAMEEERGKSLQTILDELGDEKFIELEAETVKALTDVRHAVIAPGGSVVYAPAAMEFLKNISTVVYLAADPQTIERRLRVSSRGIVGLTGKSFQELCAERENLYRRYADITVSTVGKSAEETATEIVAALAG